MTTNRHTVKVTLVAKCTVEMEVWAEDGDDPCDLTAEEETEAIGKGESFPLWEVKTVTEVLP